GDGPPGTGRHAVHGSANRMRTPFGTVESGTYEKGPNVIKALRAGPPAPATLGPNERADERRPRRRPVRPRARPRPRAAARPRRAARTQETADAHGAHRRRP